MFTLTGKTHRDTVVDDKPNVYFFSTGMSAFIDTCVQFYVSQIQRKPGPKLLFTPIKLSEMKVSSSNLCLCATNNIPKTFSSQSLTAAF